MKRKLVWATLCLLAIVVVAAALYYSLVTTVQTKVSPNGSYRAKLVRIDSIDVNFKVFVDGERVYWSSDFAPVRQDFREQINWDATGNIVVLEVGGQRLFAYDARQKRALTAGETLAVKYPPFSEYRYKGRLPNPSPAKSK
ncbi:MAG: hypothetical protein L0Z53_08535 [Acidobacteriales bacterium]|nr:hypothetical protein [Terriglobales bacterium]